MTKNELKQLIRECINEDMFGSRKDFANIGWEQKRGVSNKITNDIRKLSNFNPKNWKMVVKYENLIYIEPKIESPPRKILILFKKKLIGKLDLNDLNSLSYDIVIMNNDMYNSIHKSYKHLNYANLLTKLNELLARRGWEFHDVDEYYQSAKAKKRYDELENKEFEDDTGQYVVMMDYPGDVL